uniref:Putative secreted protein n=1 Tax=Anopheles darlingi TaxID=43151 RepID=A0A2M4DLJ0_ANODA
MQQLLALPAVSSPGASRATTINDRAKRGGGDWGNGGAVSRQKKLTECCRSSSHGTGSPSGWKIQPAGSPRLRAP